MDECANAWDPQCELIEQRDVDIAYKRGLNLGKKGFYVCGDAMVYELRERGQIYAGDVAGWEKTLCPETWAGNRGEEADG